MTHLEVKVVNVGPATSQTAIIEIKPEALDSARISCEPPPCLPLCFVGARQGATGQTAAYSTSGGAERTPSIQRAVARELKLRIPR